MPTPEQKKADMRRLKSALFRAISISALLALLVTVGVFYKEGRTPQKRQETVVEDPSLPLVKQASDLQEAFKQMASLGFLAEDIQYNTGDTKDMAGNNRPLPAPLTPPAETVRNAAAVWKIGTGQITGAFNEDAADIVFYVAGLTDAACTAINTLLWQDTSKPLLSGAPIANWSAGKVNLLQLFNGKNRSEACVQTKEGILVYYTVVAER